MTNDDVIFLAENLGFVDAPMMDNEFNYAVAYNLREAEKINKSIQKVLEKKPGMVEYDETLQKLREDFSDKDEAGEAAFDMEPIEGGMQRHYRIPGLEDPKSPFNLAVEKLRFKHEPDFKERKKQFLFLEKENKEFKPLKVNVKQIPTGLSRRAMDAVFLFTIKPK